MSDAHQPRRWPVALIVMALGSLLVVSSGCLSGADDDDAAGGDNNDNSTGDTIEWVHNEDTDNYYRLTARATWENARDEAQDLEGDLVTVDDDDENDWLVETFGDSSSAGNGFWIGLERVDSGTGDPNDANAADEWAWADGDEVTYANWGGSEPLSSGTYALISIGNNGTWMARPVNETRRGIIERDGSNPPDSGGDDDDASGDDDDNGGDDSDSDAPGDDALAFRLTHAGNGTGDDDMHQAVYSMDGTAEFWINAGDTKTIEVEYEYTYLFQGKDTGAGDAYLWAPSSITLNGTITWKVTYELDGDEACLTLERGALVEQTQEVFVYLESNPTEAVASFNIATFNGGDFVPESLADDTLCDSPYQWTDDWSGTEGELLVTYQATIELGEIDIEDVDE